MNISNRQPQQSTLSNRTSPSTTWLEILRETMPWNLLMLLSSMTPVKYLNDATTFHSVSLLYGQMDWVGLLEFSRESWARIEEVDTWGGEACGSEPVGWIKTALCLKKKTRGGSGVYPSGFRLFMCGGPSSEHLTGKRVVTRAETESRGSLCANLSDELVWFRFLKGRKGWKEAEQRFTWTWEWERAPDGAWSWGGCEGLDREGLPVLCLTTPSHDQPRQRSAHHKALSKAMRRDRGGWLDWSVQWREKRANCVEMQGSCLPAELNACSDTTRRIPPTTNSAQEGFLGEFQQVSPIPTLSLTQARWSPDLLYDMIHDHEFRMSWDENMLEGKVLERLDAHNTIGYYAVKVLRRAIASKFIDYTASIPTLVSWFCKPTVLDSYPRRRSTNICDLQSFGPVWCLWTEKGAG